MHQIFDDWPKKDIQRKCQDYFILLNNENPAGTFEAGSCGEDELMKFKRGKI